MKTLCEIREREYNRAARNLANAVGRRFPINTCVWVKRGRGVYRGYIYTNPCWWSYPGSVLIKHQRTGWVFSAHYASISKVPL